MSLVRPIVVVLGFALLTSAVSGCASHASAASTPASTPVDEVRGGSTLPDHAGGSPSEAPAALKTASGVASTKDDGSDIIPPFPSSAKEGTKGSPKASGAKKAAPKVAKKS